MKRGNMWRNSREGVGQGLSGTIRCDRQIKLICLSFHRSRHDCPHAVSNALGYLCGRFPRSATSRNDVAVTDSGMPVEVPFERPERLSQYDPAWPPSAREINQRVRSNTCRILPSSPRHGYYRTACHSNARRLTSGKSMLRSMFASRQLNAQCPLSAPLTSYLSLNYRN